MFNKLKDWALNLWHDERGAFPIDPATMAMLASTIGGLFGPNPARRQQSNMINGLNANDELSRFLRELGISTFGPGRQELLGQAGTALNPGQQQAFGGLLGVGDQLQEFGGQAPGRIQSALGFVDPRQLGAPQQEVFDAAQQDIQNRGNTEQLSFIEDRARDIFDAGLQGTAPAAQAGLDIILGGGRTPESMAMAQQMMDIIGAGGQTPQLEEMFGLGTDLVESGGFTPELRNLMGQFQSQLSAGGLTPEARRVLDPLTEIIEAGGAGGGVLSDDAAISLARDAAATANAQQANAVRRQAVQRGAAPGTVVGSGLQNQMLAEFGDAAAQNEAAAVRAAAFGQQDARLQQLGIATSGAGSILSDASRILASANAGLGDVARASSSNLASGAGLASDSQRIAAQNLGLGIQGFNQNFANEVARLGQGNQIFGGALDAFGDLSRLSLDTQLGVESARRDQQNAAAGQLLGLGDQGLAARGQNLRGAQSELDTVLRSILGQGVAFGDAGQLATQGRNQQIGAAGDLFSGGTNILGSSLPSLNSSRNSLITGNQPRQVPSPFQRFLGDTATFLGNNQGFSFGDLFGMGGASDFSTPPFQPQSQGGFFGSPF